MYRQFALLARLVMLVEEPAGRQAAGRINNVAMATAIATKLEARTRPRLDRAMRHSANDGDHVIDDKAGGDANEGKW